MHSCEALPPPPATGPPLLQRLGRLVMRARSPAAPAPRDRAPQKPSTSKQVVQQPRPREPCSPAEAQLDAHVHALWNEQIPLCIEVLLGPDCAECFAKLSCEGEAFDHSAHGPLLLERWTMSVAMKKSHEQPTGVITSQWLLSAVRSQLHFSQLGAWLARLSPKTDARKRAEDSGERRRKLSRETCNIKKLESNCDTADLPTDEQPPRQLNVVYSIKIPGESYRTTEFTRTPTDHTFPLTDIGDNVHLKVVLESLPRIGDVPTIRCPCSPPKRRASKEMPGSAHEDLTTRISDLTIGTTEGHRSHFTNDLGAINSNTGSPSAATRRLSIFNSQDSTEYILHKEAAKPDALVDDRMHTRCSENGKHKCSCDDESDQGKENRSASKTHQDTKKLDERRLKEIAKYKRRLRKESKLRKLRDSTSESTGTSEGEGLGAKSKEPHTSIPILQASRFDRFRAIGCYRNQTYLTLPASRIETKSPFLTDLTPPVEFKKTNTVATQTDDLCCHCGGKIFTECEECKRGMKRSEGNYNLTALDGADASKKLKCDSIINNNNKTCDTNSLGKDAVSAGVRKTPDDDVHTNIVKRPKLKKFLPVVGRIDKVVADRKRTSETDNDIEELLLKNDDSVFDYRAKTQKDTIARQPKSSLSEDYILYEKCYYGSFDKCDVGSPIEINNGFAYPDCSQTNPGTADPKAGCNDARRPNSPGYDSDGFQLPNSLKDSQIPSPTEMDRFRWRFDSAASMVFHTKTGLPLTSSPAPLKRGSNCFDYDDSINGISGIKSALFHPIAPRVECVSPASPRPPAPAPPPPPPRPARGPRPNVGPSGGLLGSFEESALKGRLEPAATVHGFTAELGASGAFCPPHRRLPVTVFFYAPGGTNAPYMGHINLGESGYRVARSGTIQVSLFNPHGTLVKMFVVLYELTSMPPSARTFLRQRTLYLPAGSAEPPHRRAHKYMRYLIHLRFMTSKSGKLYLHTDIRIIVSRKADLDTATAHSAIFKSISTNNKAPGAPTNQEADTTEDEGKPTNRKPCRVFGGCSDFKDFELGYGNQNGVSYELRSFTYGPENPKYSPR